MKVCRRRQRDYFAAQQLRAFAAAVVYPLNWPSGRLAVKARSR